MFTIFIVEDDTKITQLLSEHLENYGYAVKVADDFVNISEQFEAVQPDLVLLDVNLPMYDGYYWCRQIRNKSICPILFISAREGEMDQVLALENGADDYIVKPFHYEVVMAKIRSHLRRAYGSYALQQSERKVEVADLRLFPERLMMEWQGRKVDLGYKEVKLLETLMKRHPLVVSRDRLLDKIWDEHEFIEENTLNVNVARIRKKLKELGIEDAVETVRGLGYRFVQSWGIKD